MNNMNNNNQPTPQNKMHTNTRSLSMSVSTNNVRSQRLTLVEVGEPEPSLHRETVQTFIGGDIEVLHLSANLHFSLSVETIR